MFQDKTRISQPLQALGRKVAISEFWKVKKMNLLAKLRRVVPPPAKAKAKAQKTFHLLKPGDKLLCTDPKLAPDFYNHEFIVDQVSSLGAYATREDSETSLILNKSWKTQFEKVRKTRKKKENKRETT